MYGRGEDVYYYVTLYNENYPMPAAPEGVTDGIVRGIYRVLAGPEVAGGPKARVRLVGSGAILQQAVAARNAPRGTLRSRRRGLQCDLLAAAAASTRSEVERWNRLHPTQPARTPYISSVLGPEGGPVVWSRTGSRRSDLLGRWLPTGYVSLGTEGFGRSDTREALRALFEIDAPNIAVAALTAMARAGDLPAADVAAAIALLGIDPEKIDPLAF